MHITTTAIRALYDTETDELVSRNIISQQHQDSVLWLNGHSGAISRQHYIKKKQANAVKDGRYVMGLILKEGVDDAGRVALDLDGKQHSDIAERRADESRADDIAVDEDESVDFDANNRMESFECEQDEKSSVGSVGSHKERYSPREDYDIDRVCERSDNHRDNDLYRRADTEFSGREQYDTSSHNLGEKYNSKCPQDVWYKKGHRSNFSHSDLDISTKSSSDNRRDNDLYRRANTEFSGREQYNLSHCLDLETTSNSRKCTFDNVGDNHRENGLYRRAYSGLYGREHFSADAQGENYNINRPQDICYTNDRSNFSHSDLDISTKSSSDNRRDNDLYRRANTEFSGREQYNLSHCLDLETTSNSRKCTFDNVGDNHRENGLYRRAYSGLYGREHFSADAQGENYNINRPQDICYTNDRSNFSHDDLSRRTDSNGIIKASTIVRQSMGDRYHNIHKMDAFAEEIEVLRPLPLRLYTPTREAYVNWTNEEIEYARKAYDKINPTLPPDQKRFIARELLKHIRNDPIAKGIFHASHLECSGKFRHVIREYITKGK